MFESMNPEREDTTISYDDYYKIVESVPFASLSLRVRRPPDALRPRSSELATTFCSEWVTNTREVQVRTFPTNRAGIPVYDFLEAHEAYMMTMCPRNQMPAHSGTWILLYKCDGSLITASERDLIRDVHRNAAELYDVCRILDQLGRLAEHLGMTAKRLRDYFGSVFAIYRQRRST